MAPWSVLFGVAIPEKRIVDPEFFETGHMVTLRDRTLLQREMLAFQGSRLDSRACFAVWKLNHEAERRPTSRFGAAATALRRTTGGGKHRRKMHTRPQADGI